jgi:formylglycine-generating enzyme required for sulfatase activity
MRRIFSGTLAGIFLTFAGAAYAQQQPPWGDEYVNPKPARGDLILPMPCGARMAFRAVETPGGTGLLADRPIELGSVDAATAYSEFSRVGFVSGAFSQNQRRTFYIGKYEVTAGQYAAVMSADCSAPTPDSRLPAASVSWFDAVDFGRKYSAWLLANARARLPVEDGAPAYVRLPTEEEWEFAARGGVSVNNQDFRERTFPMPEGAVRYAWFQGQRSAGGRLQPIGQLEPNPLGLYDILGNAGEIVLEPFRLNKVGRLHGQAGGVVVKGGDIRTRDSELRSSYRIELPPFDSQSNGPTKLSTVGFRIALGNVAITTLERTEKIRGDFERESQLRTPEGLDARRLAALIKQNSTDPSSRDAAARLEVTLQSDERARRDIELAALRTQIEGAAYQGYLAAVRSRTLAGVLQSSPEMLAGLEPQIRTIRREIDAVVASYIALTTQLGRQPIASIQSEIASLVERMVTAGSPQFGPFVEVVAKHAAAANQGRLASRPDIQRELGEAHVRGLQALEQRRP